MFFLERAPFWLFLGGDLLYLVITEQVRDGAVFGLPCSAGVADTHTHVESVVAPLTQDNQVRIGIIFRAVQVLYMVDCKNDLASREWVRLVVCCMAEFALVSGTVAFLFTDDFPVCRVFCFVFDRHIYNVFFFLRGL